MTTTTAATLSALRALCQQGLGDGVLVPALLEALHALVPSHRNLFDWTDPQGQLLRYVIEGPIDTRVAQLYFDEFHNRRETEAMLPFQALRHQPAGVRGLDDLHPVGFYRSALYHEIWRPQGLHTRLEAVVRGRNGVLLGSLVLYRGPGDPRFTAADAQRLQALLPALAQGLEAGASGVSRAAADEPHLPSPEPAETLLLTLDGVACHASAGAWRWLLMASGGASREALSQPALAMGGPLLAQVLAQVLARLRAQQPQQPQQPQRGQWADAEGQADRADAAPALPPVQVAQTTTAGRFIATGQLLLPTGSSSAMPLVQISLRRHEPHRVALERALRGLPVTPGQMAVCRALYRGEPQTSLAQRLGVSASTVIDHVRKAYRSLDLHSAQELRALLDTRIARAAATA